MRFPVASERVRCPGIPPRVPVFIHSCSLEVPLVIIASVVSCGQSQQSRRPFRCCCCCFFIAASLLFWFPFSPHSGSFGNLHACTSPQNYYENCTNPSQPPYFQTLPLETIPAKLLLRVCHNNFCLFSPPCGNIYASRGCLAARKARQCGRLRYKVTFGASKRTQTHINTR